jgi:Ankyrin repeat
MVKSHSALPGMLKRPKRALDEIDCSREGDTNRESGRNTRLLGSRRCGFVRALFANNGHCPDEIAENAEQWFLKVSDEMISAYTAEKILLVRDNNICELRKLFYQGESMQCCNRWGESLIHMVCRLGRVEMLKFLVLECQVSLRVRDDIGRTPVHDAFWSDLPNEELLDFLLAHVPDLLLVSDRRGHLPFHYAHREHWEDWVQFFCARTERFNIAYRAEGSHFQPLAQSDCDGFVVSDVDD